MPIHHFEYNWLVPNLFAERTVNLLAGTSRMGKTALILTMLNQYAGGEGMLDYPAAEGPPKKIGALTLDRLDSALRSQVTALECEHLASPQQFPVTSLIPQIKSLARDYSENPRDEPDAFGILRATKEWLQNPQILLIESFDGLMPAGPINQHAIRKFLRDCAAFCDEWDCAIIGTCGAVKQKFGEYYTSPMDVIAGHSTWGSGVETAVILNYSESTTRAVSGTRQIYIAARGVADRYLHMKFDARGRLEPAGKIPDMIAGTKAQLYQLLAQQTPGATFQRPDFLAWGKELAISQRSVDKWLAESIELGMIEKHGQTSNSRYLKPNSL